MTDEKTPRSPVPRLDVRVEDFRQRPVPKAEVRATPIDREAEALRLEPAGPPGDFRASLAAGAYRLRVEADGFAAQEREVTVHPVGGREVFVLGERGLPSFQRGPVEVPFEPRPDLLAVQLAPTIRIERDERGEQEVEGALSGLRELGFEPAKTPEEARAEGVRLFARPRETAEGGDIAEIGRRLTERPEIERAGQVLQVRERGVTFLTDEAVVRFRPHVDEDRVARIAERLGFETLRVIPYSPNTYHFRSRTGATYELLKTLRELHESEEVEWAEPNLVVTAELDAITPTDYLWPGVWDRQLVGTPDAWQVLQDEGGQAFGEPDVVLATVDQGIESAAGVPVHPDFNGTLSDGSAKVYQLYDFRIFQPNNDFPPGDHGMGVAGVATAMANNAAAVSGQQEGLAGAAPNCPVMGLIYPSTETAQADMYIWAAGFDPNSPSPSFPATISPGADVFSTSIGFGSGAPISGTAAAMLDYLTTYGRGGKGCLCFFSAGNLAIDFTTYRPWAAYEKTFGMAASSLDTDGTTEIRAPYSGFGPVELCAPSSKNPPPHDPPNNYRTWACDLVGTGNLIAHVVQETTLTAGAAAGATQLEVADSSGFAAGDRVLLEAPGGAGGEPVVVAGVPDATHLDLTTPLLNAHTAGAPVATGPADYKNSFGGTSSATPLAAGTAALLLSAAPSLTWIEARQLLRDTAVRIDAGNTDPVGQWLDAAGNPSQTSGQPPIYSQWYGYGRIDAAAAVEEAVRYGFDRDLVVRENLGDTGTVASSGAFWSSPDLWVRNASPASEGAAALPASYAAAGPHQNPIAGQDNWVYARVKNIGTDASLDYYVRVYVTHFPGLEFTYPDSFIPSNRPGDPVPSPMVPGTYLIGEVELTGLAGGTDEIVSMAWPAALIPPETVTVSGMTVAWHPCLLIEVAPHDGPTPTGMHVWDDNNLAQKNISITYPDSDLDLAGLVVGNRANPARRVVLELDRSNVPPEVRLFVDPLDPGLTEILARELEEPTLRWNYVLGEHRGRTVAFLADQGLTRLPVDAGAGSLTPLVLGSEIVESQYRKKKRKAETYRVGVIQRDDQGEVTGAALLEVRVGSAKRLRAHTR